MLVLSRRVGEKIRIGDSIVVTLLRVDSSKKARIGVDAPRGVPIYRQEVFDFMEQERRQSAWKAKSGSRTASLVC